MLRYPNFCVVSDLIGEVIDVSGFECWDTSGKTGVYDTLSFRLRDSRYIFVAKVF